MKYVATAVLIAALCLFTAAGAAAASTDRTRFESLIFNYAVWVLDLQSGAAITPKAACACQDGRPGFVVLNDDYYLFCALPGFNRDGSLAGWEYCWTFRDLPK